MKKLLSLIFILSLISCAELQTVVNQLSVTPENPEVEVASGLKEALRIGSQNAVGILSRPDGFLKDQAVKILLPPEAQEIAKHIQKIPGGKKMVDEVVLRLNRAAEDAAKEAVPIFISAITSMTIGDAMNILYGPKTAATDYLHTKTYTQLEAKFKPKVTASLDKKLVGNYSTNDSWHTLSTNYNRVARSTIGELANMKPVETRLDTYVTRKALNGVFSKVALEEKKIRENPAARVTSLLKRVFGRLDNK